MLDTDKVKMEEYSLTKADKRRRAMFKKLDEDPERIKGSIFWITYAIFANGFDIVILKL